MAEAASDDGWSAAGFAAGATAAAAWRVDAATVLYCGAGAGAIAATTGITPVVTADACTGWAAAGSDMLLAAREAAGIATSPVVAGSSLGSSPCVAGPPAPARGPSAARGRAAGGAARVRGAG